MSGRADGEAETASTSKNVLDAARDHPWSLVVAAGALLVAFWSAFLQPALSPNGYIPLMVFYALLALGFVYVDEFSKIRLTG